jgi:hypothetical protein
MISRTAATLFLAAQNSALPATKDVTVCHVRQQFAKLSLLEMACRGRNVADDCFFEYVTSEVRINGSQVDICYKPTSPARQLAPGRIASWMARGRTLHYLKAGRTEEEKPRSKDRGCRQGRRGAVRALGREPLLLAQMLETGLDERFFVPKTRLREMDMAPRQFGTCDVAACCQLPRATIARPCSVERLPKQ